MAEAGQDVAAPQSLLHQPRRVAEALRFLEQDLDEAGLAAVPRARQRAQARRHAGGERCARRRDNAHRESRCVEFVIGAEHEGGADRFRGAVVRSEEHTSELQSRGHLVCRLLLEKKKKRRWWRNARITKQNYTRR